MFSKKKKIITDNKGNIIELQPKPGFFSRKKLAAKSSATANDITAFQKEVSSEINTKTEKPTKFRMYIESIGNKHKNIEVALRAQGMKESVYEFIKRMLIAAILMSAIIVIAMSLILINIGVEIAIALILSILMGVALFRVLFNGFLNFPTQKGKNNSKLVERDILFAARDMIISLRSGMPLYNAIMAVSTGYGEASKEFAKISQKAQIGVPLVDAIDQTIEESKSQSFKRLMLQASVSIKSGADVVASLQGVIDELTQERNIELRRYGQKLNALAMFYMLFGVILPSMGIAVITILTTFIAIFTVNLTVLEAALVGIIFLQVVFLQLIKSSRPSFTM
ncbi:MAG: type II secretion system F family protein [Candidatus Micrarchaeaceae archaeon]